ncbi:MAG: nuclear transport factor 2 family protein [Gaiellaceae bacterium]
MPPTDSPNVEFVREVYDLARRAKHDELRRLLADDVTWHPAREGAWKPCMNADEVVKTLLWRAGLNKLRPFDFLDVGDRVVFQLRGRGIGRLGARGFIFQRLFQIVVVRGGKVVSLQDYPNRATALAAAGLTK